ncbi:MAG TPA: hypothetical protein VHV27_06450 [Phenylobacterium sp.]|nr:hypothetical protein [Phenylobacterium sp.]
MFKGFLSGAVAAAMLAGSAAAAPSPPPVFSWIITPDEDSCHTDIELIGRSNNPVIIALVSDGEHVLLRFSKDEMPSRAFLAIDINKRPYSNLLTRMENPKVATMTLSDETLTALRKGGTLLIAWLADEPMTASLAGSDQGINDLKTCGAQVAAQYRAQVAGKQEAQAREEAQAHAKQLADEQLAAVRAQKQAAEAEAAKAAEETRHQEAQDEALRQQQADADRQRQADAQRQEYMRRYYPPQPSYPPAPNYYRPYPNDD